MHSATAILLFSRSALAEARDKGYGAGPAGDQKIAHALIARTKATLSRTGLPVYSIDETAQRGDRFGDRIANGIEDIYHLGYENVIVVGNDCPLLRVEHIRAAVACLKRGNAVVGADRRGGAWLIGLSSRDFDREAVSKLPWQRQELVEALVSLLPNVDRLVRLQDLNHCQDLRQFWQCWAAVLGGLHDIVFPANRSFSSRLLTPLIRHYGRRSGRAPPVAA